MEDSMPRGHLGHVTGTDPFKQEVAETFLRCLKEHIEHENAIIELNGLKIAEDRTFADCAR
jgi:translation initiation factor eIF-2B subunit epsilon